MRPDGLAIGWDGALSPDEAAALCAAVAALVDEESAAAPADAVPAAYRSAWRRAAIREALEAGRTA